MTSKNDPKHPKHHRKKSKMDADENLYTYKLVRSHTSSLYSTLSLHKIFYSVEILESRSADLYFF